MGTRFGIVDRYFSDTLDRRRCVDGPVFVEDTTVTMRGVLAEADIHGYVKVWEEGSESPDGEDDRTVLVVRWCATLIL